jgi:hypothetical protein
VLLVDVLEQVLAQPFDDGTTDGGATVLEDHREYEDHARGTTEQVEVLVALDHPGTDLTDEIRDMVAQGTMPFVTSDAPAGQKETRCVQQAAGGEQHVIRGGLHDAGFQQESLACRVKVTLITEATIAQFEPEGHSSATRIDAAIHGDDLAGITNGIDRDIQPVNLLALTDKMERENSSISPSRRSRAGGSS